MGWYLNPHEVINQIGRRLPILYVGGFDYYQKQLGENEVLVGQFDRIVFKNTVVLFCEKEFDEFKKQLDNGIIILVGYFAVKFDDLNKGMSDMDVESLKDFMERLKEDDK